MYVTSTGGGNPNRKPVTQKENNSVKQAEAKLQEQMAQKPGAYQSQWQAQLDATMDKILNREEFSYDMNGDALYQQYKDKYVAQGQKAMMDTMGQAAALTGGYGNSYAQMAGQQAYHGYLQDLNDQIPELYQLALSRYQAEGDDLTKQYGILADREADDYGRYQDQVSDWQAAVDRAQNNLDYERNYLYQLGRDKVADQQWQAEFDEAKRRYDQEWAYETGAVSGGGSGTGGSDTTGTDYSSSGSEANGGVSSLAIKQMQSALGVSPDGIWGEASRAAAMAAYGISDPATLYKFMHQASKNDNTDAVISILTEEYPSKVITSSQDWTRAAEMVGGADVLIANGFTVKTGSKSGKTSVVERKQPLAREDRYVEDR
jgi:hypothetical protein